LPDGDTYQAFKVRTGFAKPKELEFEVNKSWLDSQNASPANVKLYGKGDNETEWSALNTLFLKLREDNQSYHFKAPTSGLSSFVVFLSVFPCEINSKRCLNNQIQLCVGNSTWLVVEGCNYGCGNKTECINPTLMEKMAKGPIWLYASIVVVGFFLLFWTYVELVVKRKVKW
jgi:hypothetical protein